MGSSYERELKHILQGEAGAIQKILNQYSDSIKEDYQKIQKKPFLVVRAAGSLGVDLVAIRDDISFPIEVKSCISNVMHFSDNSNRANEQAQRMKASCDRAGVIPVYAFRLKNVRNEDSWRIFTIDACVVKGRWALLYERIPKLDKTPNGSYVMRWPDGMPLHKFIDYLCS